MLDIRHIFICLYIFCCCKLHKVLKLPQKSAKSTILSNFSLAASKPPLLKYSYKSLAPERKKKLIIDNFYCFCHLGNEILILIRKSKYKLPLGQT